MKNGQVMPIRRSRAKGAVGLFWTKCEMVAILATFSRYQLQICFAHHLNKDGWANQFQSQSDLIWPFEPVRTYKKH